MPLLDHLCQLCKVHLSGRPHPVVVQVDGYVVQRIVLCAVCRESMVDALNVAWGSVIARAEQPLAVS